MLKTRVVIMGLAAGWVLSAGPASGQVGFKQDERLLVQKYKASNAKFEEGKALFQKGKVDKAGKKLQECLEIFPKNPDARYLMAQIEIQEGNLDAALASIETAETNFVEIGQLYTFTHHEMLSDLREQRARVEESIRAGEGNLADLRSQPRSDMTQAAISSAEGNLEKDTNTLAKIDLQLQNPIPQTLEVPPGYHYVHGNVLFKSKRFAEAADQYLETIRLEPRHEFAYNNLASLYFATGQFQKALDFLRRAKDNGVKVNAAFKKDLEERLAKK